MRVMLVGAGGREAALAWRLSQSQGLSHLLVTGLNPGWPKRAQVCPAVDVQEICRVAVSERVDLVIVGPEVPLAEGLADLLDSAGVPCFGPRQAAARLEASKAFSKEIMAAAGVPTAEALVVDRADSVSVAAGRARCDRGEVVVKADGLAAGKGVIVCRTPAEAHAALDDIWDRFADAASRVVLEDRLVGPEVSVFGISDGERVVGLPSSQDHKRIGDGDIGPNTGGMGAYAPCPLVPQAEVDRLISEIHVPVIAELARRGVPFRGVLFAGLMLTADGPKVLEFNVRFGDPECQPLMCLWEDDLLPWLHGAAVGVLPPGRPRFSSASSCCVVLASRGYPQSSEKGILIPEPEDGPGVEVFHAGTRRDSDGSLKTNGGRVLGVTGTASDLRTARDRAYVALESWRFPGSQNRMDIAARGIDAS